MSYLILRRRVVPGTVLQSRGDHLHLCWAPNSTSSTAYYCKDVHPVRMCSFEDAYSCKEVRLQCTLVLEGQKRPATVKGFQSQCGAGGEGMRRRKKSYFQEGLLFHTVRLFKKWKYRTLTWRQMLHPIYLQSYSFRELFSKGTSINPAAVSIWKQTTMVHPAYTSKMSNWTIFKYQWANIPT